MAKNNACIPNVEWMFRAGINPATGLPIKMDFGNPTLLKENIKKELRIADEQDAVNRGTWYNLPCNLTSRELERMLYYKGQLAFFYNKDLDEFYFLPFALSSEDGNGLDVYGRYNQIRPIAYNASATDEKNNRKTTPIETFLSQLHLNVKYTPMQEIVEDDLYNSAVILQDYTPQYNNMNIIPRYQLQDSLLDAMAECPCYARTSAILGSGISGIRVNDADQAGEVMEGSKAMQDAALTGKAWIPITGQIEFQELTGAGKTNNIEEYFEMMQSLDNLRLSFYGIDNGGIFEKKAHMLQSEADLNGGPVGLVMQDCISIRQNFCNIVNSIWGLGIWYEPSETISKADTNGDGVLYDRDENGENSGYNGNSTGGSDVYDG